MGDYSTGALGGNILILVLIVLIAISVINWNRKKSRYFMKNGSKRILATIIGALVVFWLIGAMAYNDGSTFYPKPPITSKSWTQEDKQSFYSTCINNATRVNPDNPKDTTNKYCACVTDNIVKDYPDINKANQLSNEEYISWEKKLIGTCQ